MRFLIDNALSPRFSEELKKLGYDSCHVREYGLQFADNETVFDRAKEFSYLIEKHGLFY